MAYETEIPEGVTVPRTLYVGEPRLAYFAKIHALSRGLPITVLSFDAQGEVLTTLANEHPDFFVSESLGCGRVNNRALKIDLDNVRRAREIASDIPTAVIACCDNELTLPLLTAHREGIIDAVMWPGYQFSHMNFGMRIVQSYARAQETRNARLKTGT